MPANLFTCGNQVVKTPILSHRQTRMTVLQLLGIIKVINFTSFIAITIIHPIEYWSSEGLWEGERRDQEHSWHHVENLLLKREHLLRGERDREDREHLRRLLGNLRLKKEFLLRGEREGERTEREHFWHLVENLWCKKDFLLRGERADKRMRHLVKNLNLKREIVGL